MATHADTVAGQGVDAVRPTLADIAYAELKRRILTVELAPGTHFREADAVAAVDLGKTPVREALLRLGLERLVEVSARSGYRVAPVTLKGAADVCDLRAVLEGEVALRVASLSTRPLDELRRVARTGEPAHLGAWLDAERAFHLALARAAGNDELVRTLHGVLERFERLCHLAVRLAGGSAVAAHDHGPLLEAIAAGRAAEARTLVVEEVRSAQALVMQSLISSESVSTANVGATPGAPRHTFYLNVPDPPEGGRRTP
jgi:DNA-binding GntR family transcriptional regulator